MHATRSTTRKEVTVNSVVTVSNQQDKESDRSGEKDTTVDQGHPGFFYYGEFKNSELENSMDKAKTSQDSQTDENSGAGKKKKKTPKRKKKRKQQKAKGSGKGCGQPPKAQESASKKQRIDAEEDTISMMVDDGELNFSLELNRNKNAMKDLDSGRKDQTRDLQTEQETSDSSFNSDFSSADDTSDESLDSKV